MKIIVTNVQGLLLDLYRVRQVNFNPWGFSRAGIESQIASALNEQKINDTDQIIFCVENLFFGTRAQIALDWIAVQYPKNKVARVTPRQLISFLDDAAV